MPVETFEYAHSERYTAMLVSDGRYCRRLAISFSSATDVALPGIGDVSADYYFPRKKQKAPLVVLVHGVGDTSIIPCRALARSLSGVGIASLVLYMPIHSRRLTPDLKARFFSLSVEEWLALYRLSVINIRQALDWAETRPEIDHQNMGIAGISFGAYVSAIALGVDERLKSGAILLTSGNQEKVNWTRTTKRFERYSVSEEGFRDGQRRYLNYVAEVAKRGYKNVVPPRPSYLFDPYTYSATIRQREVLLVNALWDEYFPRQAAKDFGEACGSPEQLWLPTGHASAWLFYPLIKSRVIKLFRRSLLTKAGV